MKPSVFTILILGLISIFCSRGQTVASSEAPVFKSESAHKMQPSLTLFLDTDEVGPPPVAPQIVRYRFVRINFDLLFDRRRRVRSTREIAINLFPDVIYTGVIERVEFDGSGYSWSGHLKGVPLSNLNMVYTAGVFIAHFASPGGVYEVSVVGEKDLYCVVMIDQQKLPQDEGG
jgi:hypothetical protein